MPWEFDKLENIAAAAPLTALAHAGPGGTPLGIEQRLGRLTLARRTTNRWGEEVHWDPWLSNIAIANFWSYQRTLAAQSITLGSLEDDLRKGMTPP